jgi:hypothetical protein
MAYGGRPFARMMPFYREMMAPSASRAPRPALAVRRPGTSPDRSTATMTGASQSGVANTSPKIRNDHSASGRTSILGSRSSITVIPGHQEGGRRHAPAGPMFLGWGDGNVGVASTRAGSGTGGYGFSGWGFGYASSGYRHVGNGYGYNGWGSGYGRRGSGTGNSQYVWVFIPGLGWVFVPIGLLMMLGL